MNREIIRKFAARNHRHILNINTITNLNLSYGF